MESVMNQENSFHYKYSAVENREIEEIRKKYITAVESKMGELKRLDAGDEMCPEIMERYQSILEAKAEIECLEKGRKAVKVVCPECGHKTSVKMNYCGKCGVLLKTEVDIFEEQIIENELFEDGEE